MVIYYDTSMGISYHNLLPLPLLLFLPQQHYSEVALELQMTDTFVTIIAIIVDFKIMVQFFVKVIGIEACCQSAIRKPNHHTCDLLDQIKRYDHFLSQHLNHQIMQDQSHSFVDHSFRQLYS